MCVSAASNLLPPRRPRSACCQGIARVEDNVRRCHTTRCNATSEARYSRSGRRWGEAGGKGVRNPGVTSHYQQLRREPPSGELTQRA